MPIEQEEKEKAEKEKKEKEKIEREALKKAMKNERKQLRTLCKDNEYFTEDADEKVQNLTDLDRCELCYVVFFFFRNILRMSSFPYKIDIYLEKYK